MRAGDLRLGVLYKILSVDRLRNIHHQRIGYAVEHAEHKREAVALARQRQYSGVGTTPRTLCDHAAGSIQRDYVSHFDALCPAAIDRDHRLVAAFAELGAAAVDGNDATVDLHARRARRVGRYLRPAGGDELVAHAYFLRNGGEQDDRGVAGARDARRAEVDRLETQRGLRVRVDQRPAASVDEPVRLRRRTHAARESAVAGFQDHA